MKEFVIKVSKIISVFALAFLFIFLDFQEVQAESKTIKLGDATLLPRYVAGVRFNIKTLKNGGYVYCVDINKNTARNVSANLVGTMDAGVAYILENGYPKKSFTGEKKKDYYITQAAVWWYLDDTAGGSNLSKSFKTDGSDSYGLRKHIKKLVDGAKKAKKEGYKKSSVAIKLNDKELSLSSDKKYYVSKKIDANAKNINGKYTVSIVDAPNGTVVTNVSGVKQTKFSQNEKFLIKVPANKVEAGRTVVVKVKINATSKVNKAYQYQPTDKSMQPVVLLAPVEKELSDSVKLAATKPKEVKPSIVVKKVDKDTGKTIKGATLVIKDSKGKVVKEFISSESGAKFTDLKVGETYMLTETKAPAGYIKTNEEIKFTVPNKTIEKEIKISNKKIEKKVVINKVDKDTKQPVLGAILVIKDSNGNVVRRFMTQKTSIVITDLPNGMYTVEEESAPVGYKLSTEKQVFTINDENSNVEVTFYNEKQNKVVVINKVDRDTKQPISGATLVVKDSKGNVVKRFETTKSSYIITDLANGVYTVEEEKAPVGYKLSIEKQTFTIDNNSSNVEVTFYNDKQDKVVFINKIDKDTKQPVIGATLVVKDSKGNTVKSFETTKSSYVITDLANGVYTVEEVKAPAGYKLSKEKQIFTIDDKSSNVEVTFYNEKEVEKEVIINKIDKTTKQPVEGAILVVKDNMGNVIKEFETTTAGYRITGLANGSYTVEEVKAPVGYKLSTEKKSFTVTDDTKNITVDFENELEESVVTIAKIDSTTGKYVSGAEILVKNDKGEEIARFISSNSNYVLRNLEYGTYTVEELSSPEGYFLNEEVQTFVIDATHSSARVTIKNIPKTCENGGIDEDECYVKVPNTGSNNALFGLLGIAITGLGVGYVYKTNKQQG